MREVGGEGEVSFIIFGVKLPTSAHDMNNGSEFLEDNLGCLFLCKNEEHIGHVKHRLHCCQYYHCRTGCANTMHYTVATYTRR